MIIHFRWNDIPKSFFSQAWDHYAATDKITNSFRDRTFLNYIAIYYFFCEMHSLGGKWGWTANLIINTLKLYVKETGKNLEGLKILRKHAKKFLILNLSENNPCTHTHVRLHTHTHTCAHTHTNTDIYSQGELKICRHFKRLNGLYFE